jgi:hypothetical protein
MFCQNSINYYRDVLDKNLTGLLAWQNHLCHVANGSEKIVTRGKAIEYGNSPMTLFDELPYEAHSEIK